MDKKTTGTQSIGKYDIVAELGRGGMGVVYKAWEDSLQRFVAIKMLGDQLTQDDSLVERFLREARAVADLNHPNVVQVYAVDTFHGRPYFAMEYVEGQSLKNLIHSNPRMHPRRAAQIILDAATGLAAAHDRDVVHRDIKPDNLMLAKDGRVKLVDFGIAKVDRGDATLTRTGVMVGTPNYISPEVCLGQKVDARSDIFSLGIVFYEMLAGKTPFQADSPIDLMTAVVKADVPDITLQNPAVDGPLREILSRMLSKERDERYQSCAEIIADLQGYLQEAGAVAAQPAIADDDETLLADAAGAAATQHAAPARSGNRGLQAGWVIGLLLIVGAAAGSWFYAGAPAPGDLVSMVDTADGQTGADSAAADGGGEDSAAADANAGDGSGAADKSGTAGESDAAAEINASADISASAEAKETAMDAADSGAGFSATGFSVIDKGTDEGSSQLSSRGGGMDSQVNTLEPGLPADSPTSAPVAGDTHPTPQAPLVAMNTTTPRVVQIDKAAEQPLEVALVTPAAPPAPPKLVVIARGDPAVSGVVEAVLENALSAADFELLDEQFISGLSSAAYRADLSEAGRKIQDNGGSLLVLVDVRETGRRELSFYGRSEIETTANLQVQLLSVAEKNKVGAPWLTSMSYVPLNASDTAREVSQPIAAEMVERLQALATE